MLFSHMFFLSMLHLEVVEYVRAQQRFFFHIKMAVGSGQSRGLIWVLIAPWVRKHEGNMALIDGVGEKMQEKHFSIFVKLDFLSQLLGGKKALLLQHKFSSLRNSLGLYRYINPKKRQAGMFLLSDDFAKDKAEILVLGALGTLSGVTLFYLLLAGFLGFLPKEEHLVFFLFNGFTIFLWNKTVFVNELLLLLFFEQACFLGAA
ncbi:hypothetical protein ACJX0J_011902, partial [Zea mays]